MKFGRRDANHQEVRDAFRRLGWSVLDTADLGHILVEVKAPGGIFTQDEIDFSMEWRGDYVTVRSLEDVVRLTERR
jgi:hypothetical protein